MSKVIDITEKLRFNENPALKVKDQVLEVQADAENVLKIMGLFNGEKDEGKAAIEAAELIFSKEDQKKIKNMKLQFNDYLILIQEAIDLATNDGEEGEKQ